MSKLRKAEALHRKADMGLWVLEPMAGWSGWDAIISSSCPSLKLAVRAQAFAWCCVSQAG